LVVLLWVYYITERRKKLSTGLIPQFFDGKKGEITITIVTMGFALPWII